MLTPQGIMYRNPLNREHLARNFQSSISRTKTLKTCMKFQVEKKMKRKKKSFR